MDWFSKGLRMPIERLAWVPVQSFDQLNAQMRRVVDVTVPSARAATQTVTSSGPLALTYPQTVVLADSTAGSLVLTLPPAQSVPGFWVQVKKVAAANTVTINPNGSELIDDLTTLAWTAQWGTYTLVTNGVRWYAVANFGFSTVGGGGTGVPAITV